MLVSGGQMAAYRLYAIDGAGNFSAAEWIEAEDDESAVENARILCRGSRCELWKGPRFVATIETGRPSGSAR